MNTPANLDLSTVTVNDIVEALYETGASPDTAGGVANLERADDVLADVWTGEECAEIERALRYLAA